jgi:hypothetical protein
MTSRQIPSDPQWRARSSAGAALSPGVQWQWRVVRNCRTTEIERQSNRAVSYNKEMNFGGVAEWSIAAVLKNEIAVSLSGTKSKPSDSTAFTFLEFAGFCVFCRN